jgi:hypothetical protein
LNWLKKLNLNNTFLLIKNVTMSPKERELQQHETIDTMAKQVATMIKWWPLVAGAGSLVIAIGTLAIAGYKYDDNLVKKDEYAKMIRAVERIAAKQTTDSTYTHQGLVVVNRRIDSVITVKTPQRRQPMVKLYTSTHDKNGVRFDPYTNN